MRKCRTYHPRRSLIHDLNVRDHPNYMVWANMLSRCLNPNDTRYKHYGDRGITVCERWLHFRYFVEDMGIRPDNNLTIERINNNRGYEPSNCRWDTYSRQCFNRRKFKNNTSGETGVEKKSSGNFQATFQYEYISYNIGHYLLFEDAVAARHAFVELFFSDRELAIASLPKETLWLTSSSRVRGITPHLDGGYIARCTINKVRYYVGYFKTIDEAKNARIRFIEERTG